MITLLLLASCAKSPDPTAAAEATACFPVSLVSGFDDVGLNTVRLSVPGRDGYDLLLSGFQCDDVAWAAVIQVEPGVGTSQICVGEGPNLGRVHFRDGPGGRRLTCRIDSVQRASG